MRKIALAVLWFVCLSLLSACTGRILIPLPADPAALQGSYTLYLYGCHYSDDIENAAFLIADNARYPFELYTLDTAYRVERGLPAAEALAKADAFLRCGIRVWQTKIRRIPDDAGGTMGYEVLPLYVPYTIGVGDPLLITYGLRNGRVRAILQPNPTRRQDLGPGDGPGQGHP